jgi:hypothetical protein
MELSTRRRWRISGIGEVMVMVTEIWYVSLICRTLSSPELAAASDVVRLIWRQPRKWSKASMSRGTKEAINSLLLLLELLLL